MSTTQTWNIDASHSSIHFSIRHLVISKVRGQFTRWSGAFTVSGDDFTNASVTATQSVTLALTWSDGAGAGVVRMRFSDDGANWTPWESTKPSRAYTLPLPNGYHTVRVQYLDAANNYSLAYNDYIKLQMP